MEGCHQLDHWTLEPIEERVRGLVFLVPAVVGIWSLPLLLAQVVPATFGQPCDLVPPKIIEPSLLVF